MGCSLLHEQYVSTAPNGRAIQGKPEWKLAVTYTCTCPQSGITLACNGFHQSLVEIILLSSKRMVITASLEEQLNWKKLTLSYAWETLFPFLPVVSLVHRSKITCASASES
ncbi:hypothetical protein NMG60_11000959 [Bertholletia excelsa]